MRTMNEVGGRLRGYSRASNIFAGYGRLMYAMICFVAELEVSIDTYILLREIRGGFDVVSW